jgi:ABC-2 type transport system permease protein
MNGDERIPTSFSLARRWGAGLNLIITMAAVLSIIAMVNYLGMRRYARLDLSRTADGELSKRTQHVLATLTNEVTVITYYNSQNALFPRIRALLKEYETASGNKIRVQHVDYLRDPSAAESIQTKYKLSTAGNKDVIIFDSGNRQKLVHETELSDYDMSNVMSGQTNEFKRTHFKGEILFTSAIFSVTSLRSPKAYFLIGHGEHLPVGEAATDPTDGYAEYANVLRNENNIEIAPLDLVFNKEVPSDCSVLVVAGPVQMIADEQADRIQRYLEGGGRMLVLFRSRSLGVGRSTGLEKLLVRWGVKVDANIITDRENATSESGADPKPVSHGMHPIVNSLGNSRLHLLSPRSLHALPQSGARREETKVEELLFTGPNTVAITDFTPRGQYKTQQVGPQPLAVAVERSIPGVTRGATRIVAIGDSTMWGNRMIISEANRVFASSTINWLVNQNVLLSEIPRQAIKTYKLSMTQSQMHTSRLLLLIGMPAVVLFAGFIVWVRRRN